MRILLADDHAILRQGLKQILADEFAGAQFGEAGSTVEALRQLRNQAWDVLILDINMPGRSGLEVLDEARRDHPRLPVLVLSSTPEDQLALRVLRAGASGYLNKQSAAEELVGAVRKIASGGRYVSAALAEKLAADLSRGPERAPHELLSDREFLVFRKLVEGRAVKEIAVELSLSIKTISTFRARIFQKLGVDSNVALVYYAQRHGIVEASPAEEKPLE